MSPRASIAVRLLAVTVVAAAVGAGPALAQVVRDTTPPDVTFTVPTEGQVFASDQGAEPAVKRLAHASSAPVSAAQLRPGSRVAVRVTVTGQDGRAARRNRVVSVRG